MSKITAEVVANSWFYLVSTLSIILYISDICTDIVLAYHHFANGDQGWGGLTVFFIVFSWYLSAFVACVRRESKKTRLFYVSTVLNLYPVLVRLESMLERWRGDKNAAKTKSETAKLAQRLLNLGESYPQLCLQIYIVGYENRFDALSLFSIATSLASVSFGLGAGFLNCPLCFLFFISGVPSISLLASLKNHSTPSFAALQIYFYIHFTIITTSLALTIRSLNDLSTG